MVESGEYCRWRWSHTARVDDEKFSKEKVDGKNDGRGRTVTILATMFAV